MKGLLSHFETLINPRVERIRLHSLKDIIAITITESRQPKKSIESEDTYKLAGQSVRWIVAIRGWQVAWQYISACQKHGETQARQRTEES